MSMRTAHAASAPGACEAASQRSLPYQDRISDGRLVAWVVKHDDRLSHSNTPEAKQLPRSCGSVWADERIAKEHERARRNDRGFICSGAQGTDREIELLANAQGQDLAAGTLDSEGVRATCGEEHQGTQAGGIAE